MFIGNINNTIHFYSESSISRKEVPISEMKMEFSLHQRQKSTVREYYNSFVHINFTASMKMNKLTNRCILPKFSELIRIKLPKYFYC